MTLGNASTSACPCQAWFAGCHIDRHHRKTFYPGPGRKQGAETSVKVPRKKPDLNSRELNTGDVGWVCSPLSENESLGNNLSQLYAPEPEKRVMQTLSSVEGWRAGWLSVFLSLLPEGYSVLLGPQSGAFVFRSEHSSWYGTPLLVPSLALQTPFLQELAMHAVSPP